MILIFHFYGIQKNADKIRNWIQDSKCICTQECNLSTNFLIQPKTWPSLIIERIKCLKNG
jgi:hypothetical protein